MDDYEPELSSIEEESESNDDSGVISDDEDGMFIAKRLPHDEGGSDGMGTCSSGSAEVEIETKPRVRKISAELLKRV